MGTRHKIRRAGSASVALALLAIAALALAPSTPAEQAASQQAGVVQGFIDAGASHTCAVLDGGGVRCWGEGTDGRLGTESTADIGDTEFPEASFTNAGGNVRAIASGFAHTCALHVDHTVRCWGLGLAGRLGYGSASSVGDAPAEMPPPAVDVGGSAVAITAGGNHTCVILADGSVRCWGGGSGGRLGSGSPLNIGEAPGQMPPPAVPLGGRAVAISAGTQHTCAVLEGGSVRCWGAGASGELGNGDDTVNIGDAPGEMPPPPVNVGGSAVAVSAGVGHTCALLVDRTVRCWGDGASGQLGKSDGTLTAVGDDPGEMPPAAVSLGGNAKGVSAGRNHTCALVGFAVKCWGQGSFGQLGYGSNLSIGDALGEMPPPEVDIGGFAEAITTGDFHTCALLGSGDVRCWGAGSHGRLGSRTTTNFGDGAGETPATLAPVPLGGSVVTDVADVSLRLATSSSTALVGQRMTITVAASSIGPNDGTGIVVALRLPRGLSYVSGPMDPSTGLMAIGTAQSSGNEEVRDVVVRVTDPGALGIGAEIAAADLLDPDSTPGNGVAGEDDEASASVAAKVRPDALGLTLSPNRDTRGRVRFSASGRLAVSGGVAGVCSGKVGLTVKAGAKKVSSKRASLKLGGGECSYRASFSLARAGKIGRAGSLRVSADFGGNALALARSSKSASLRVR